MLPLKLRADAALLRLQFGMKEVDDKIDIAARHVRRVNRIVFKVPIGITLGQLSYKGRPM